MLALILPDEEVFEEVSEELQRDILERERRAVEQLEQIEISFPVQLDQRGPFWVSECGVGAADDVFQVFRRNFARKDVKGDNLKGQVFKAEVAPIRLPRGGDRGDLFGDEETAIGGQTFQDDIFKGELSMSSAVSRDCIASDSLHTRNPSC